MAEDKDQEKSEPATPKKREDARKKGQVAQSREIPTVIILFSALGFFYFSGSWMILNLTGFLRGFYQNIFEIPLGMSSAHSFLFAIAEKIFWLILPFFSVVLVAGLAANLMQVGFHISEDALKPKLSKLNPLKGMKKFVSLHALSEIIKSVLKILIIGGTAIIVINSELDGIPPLMRMGIGDILTFLGLASQKIVFYTCLVLIILSLADYIYQRWEFEKNLKMTKQEIKDEYKQSEGDPMVRARIKRLQTEMARHRMMESVPEADVIVTNPTHIAVALKYDPKEMAAPKLIAKGADLVAQRIKEIARETDIPVVENKPLARTIFRSVELEGYIPADLYKAVAEILAYVYNLKNTAP